MSVQATTKIFTLPQPPIAKPPVDLNNPGQVSLTAQELAIPPDPNIKLSIRDKHIVVNYHDAKEVELDIFQYKFLAKVMNFFAKYFPRIAQGVATISVDGQNYLVRRKHIQDVFNFQERHPCNESNSVKNTIKLIDIATKYFTKANP